ncbi:serine hydrolase [Parvularcula sp. ZS-1/3]|uniref:Serine hydrolase n=1 Tax=Parvularcula mediterranea TaxID=2732508 RepID=A0A7Y3W6E9_9PROT|nr:serine hydrolase [Parvularcula mediterranea]NNU17196.1 serine hydrolase [Parvularcula mediterranea]
MKKLLLPAFALLCAGVIAAAFWYVRPGSEFSPREVIAMVNIEDRREVFRRMETVYPSREVEPGEFVTTFPRAVTPLSVSYEWDGAERTFEDYAARRNVQGILVLKDGVVVHERYFGEADAEDRFTSWSVAKSYISTLTAIAVEEGVIESFEDKASRYAKDYAGTDFGDTSIRHLLWMSSGIDFDENYENPKSDIRKLFVDTFLWNKDVDDVVRAHRRNRPAGQDLDYISSNTQVLAGVLRGAYDMSLIEIFNEKLAQPLGYSGGSWLTDRQGIAAKELGYCCLQLTLEDYAKLGQLYVQDGVFGEERILPAGWVDMVRTPPQASHEPGGDGQLGYSYQFWLPGGDEGSFTMQGYNGQFVHMDPDLGAVIVMVSADRGPVVEKPEFVQLFRAIKNQLPDDMTRVRRAGL